MGMVYKRMDFRREWYTKKYILDRSGIRKDGFQTGVVYKRIDFRREWCTKEWILNRIIYYIIYKNVYTSSERNNVFDKLPGITNAGGREGKKPWPSPMPGV